MTRGILFNSIGKPVYQQLTTMAIESLRLSGNDDPVTVISPWKQWPDASRLNFSVRSPAGYPGFPEHCGHRQQAHWCKMHGHLLTPYHETLYLDSDLLVHGSLEGLWNYSQGSDLAVCLDTLPTLAEVVARCPEFGSREDWVCTSRLVGSSAAHWNTGVLRWTQSAIMHRLFQLWYHEFLEYKATDQSPFMRAVHRTGPMMAILPSRYNAGPHPRELMSDPPFVIWHYRGMHPGYVAKRMRASLDELQERLGQTCGSK